MGSKMNPGKFDCYAKAADDEPIFILRAKDPVAPCLVRAWRFLRAKALGQAMTEMIEAAKEWEHACDNGRTPLPLDSEKSTNADAIAEAMEVWREEHPAS